MKVDVTAKPKTYSVKEVFYTLQGEGANAGRPAVFVRFAGCNLWSGRAEDRGEGSGSCSAWCDTDFVGVDGIGGGVYRNSQSLVEKVVQTWPQRSRPFVVCTGGEPLLQLDEWLIAGLRRAGCEIAIETNGTLAAPEGLDWVCVSPKAGSKIVVTSGHELKFVYPQEASQPVEFQDLDFLHFWIQPMDGPQWRENVSSAVQYCLRNPQWKLSLQTHKLLGIP